MVDRVKQLEHEQLHTARSFPIRPVHALILDFQMPKKKRIAGGKGVERILQQNRSGDGPGADTGVVSSRANLHLPVVKCWKQSLREVM